MTEINLLDYKGEYVSLTFPCVYQMSRKGLTETWCYAYKGWFPAFQRIPLPVFTEWWEYYD